VRGEEGGRPAGSSVERGSRAVREDGVGIPWLEDGLEFRDVEQRHCFFSFYLVVEEDDSIQPSAAVTCRTLASSSLVTDVSPFYYPNQTKDSDRKNSVTNPQEFRSKSHFINLPSSTMSGNH
jgi:hypothetical protein